MIFERRFFDGLVCVSLAFACCIHAEVLAMGKSRAKEARREARSRAQYEEPLPSVSTEYGRIYAQLDRNCIQSLRRPYRDIEDFQDLILGLAERNCRRKRRDQPATGIRHDLTQKILDNRRLKSRLEAENSLNYLVARMTYFMSSWETFINRCRDLSKDEQAGCRYHFKKFPGALRKVFIPQIDRAIALHSAQFARLEIDDQEPLFERFRTFRSSVEAVSTRIEQDLGLQQGASQ